MLLVPLPVTLLARTETVDGEQHGSIEKVSWHRQEGRDAHVKSHIVGVNVPFFVILVQYLRDLCSCIKPERADGVCQLLMPTELNVCCCSHRKRIDVSGTSPFCRMRKVTVLAISLLNVNRPQCKGNLETSPTRHRALQKTERASLSFMIVIARNTGSIFLVGMLGVAC